MNEEDTPEFQAFQRECREALDAELAEQEAYEAGEEDAEFQAYLAELDLAAYEVEQEDLYVE